MAVIVDRTGHQLFSRPSLPIEEDGRRRIRYFSDGLIHLEHLGGSSNDVFKLVLVKKFLPIKFVFLDKPSLLDSPLDGEFDFFKFKGFADVIKGSLLDRFDGRINRSKGGNHNHSGLWGAFFKGAEDLHPVLVSHPYICDDNIEKVAHPSINGFFAAQGGGDFVTLLGKYFF